jgi:uncharacterized protein (DUF1800 family)
MQPTPEVILLHKIGYGHSTQSLQYIQKVGIEKYIAEQLKPTAQDPAAEQALQKASLEIQYNHKGTKVKETRPLENLDKKISELWPIRSDTKAYAEKIRPAQEVAAAAIIRAQYSQWQLRELVIDFWHNHFNINAFGDEKIALLFPDFDKNVIRKHCFGNFRTLLEAVAKHPAMLFYLDNANSKASPANENYARELLELHTLGAENYLNNLYDQWRDVPKDSSGTAKGYIDEDVYETARAFTGWTVADGSHDGKGGNLPNTGEFYYCETWHDQYQKRVLNTEIPHHQAPLADGLKVLDLLANHPATAKTICRKLCIRLVSDTPPTAILNTAIATFIAQKDNPTQITEVLKAIITHPDFLKNYGQKTKTPLELVVSFARATATPLNPNANLYRGLQQMGQQLYSWPTPTGHPDSSQFWLNTNMLLSRWNTMTTIITEDWHQIAAVDLAALLGKEKKSCRLLAADLYTQIVGYAPTEAENLSLANYIAMGGSIDELPFFDNERQARWQLANAVALICQMPNFQKK